MAKATVRCVLVRCCAECPFSSGESAEMCAATRGRARRIPDSVNVDRERPKWCPLPIHVVADESTVPS